MAIRFPCTCYMRRAYTKPGNHHGCQLARYPGGFQKTSPAGKYVNGIDELVHMKLLPAMPVNPFTGKLMREIRFGDSPFKG